MNPSYPAFCMNPHSLKIRGKPAFGPVIGMTYIVSPYISFSTDRANCHS